LPCADADFAPVRGGGTPERVRGRDGIAQNGICYHATSVGQPLSVMRRRRFGARLSAAGHSAVFGEAENAVQNHEKQAEKRR